MKIHYVLFVCLSILSCKKDTSTPLPGTVKYIVSYSFTNKGIYRLSQVHFKTETFFPEENAVVLKDTIFLNGIKPNESLTLMINDPLSYKAYAGCKTIADFFVCDSTISSSSPIILADYIDSNKRITRYRTAFRTITNDSTSKVVLNYTPADTTYRIPLKQ